MDGTELKCVFVLQELRSAARAWCLQGQQESRRSEKCGAADGGGKAGAGADTETGVTDTHTLKDSWRFLPKWGAGSVSTHTHTLGCMEMNTCELTDHLSCTHPASLSRRPQANHLTVAHFVPIMHQKPLSQSQRRVVSLSVCFSNRLTPVSVCSGKPDTQAIFGYLLL